MVGSSEVTYGSDLPTMPLALEFRTEILARYEKRGLDVGAQLHATPVLNSRLEILFLVFPAAT
jgi:hypothetical protein